MRQGVVGVLGPKAAVEILATLGEHYPQLQLLPLMAQDVTAARALLETHQADIDILLVLDPRFLRLNRLVPSSLPMLPVNLWRPGIHRALFHARDLIYPEPAPISVDPVLVPDAEFALEELHLPSAVIGVQPLDSDESLAEEHRLMHRKERTVAALTVSPLVHDDLIAQHVQSFLIQASEEAAHQGLHDAVLQAAALESSDCRVMIGLIHVDNFVDTCRQMRSDFEVHKLKLRLNEQVLELVQPLGGFLMTELLPDISVIATRGLVEEQSDHFRKALFVGSLARNLSLSVSEGWGAGQTADGARHNARMALNFAIQNGGGCAYVMLEDSRCVGPLGSETPTMQLRLRSVDPELQQQISGAGVSARTIDQIANLSRKLSRSTFTSDEVASELRMTERNARRILDRLCNAGLVSAEGQQVLHTRGRPRRVFQLNSVLLQS